MSINVTVNGNRLNIRRGRMVLSDLDQIKKNERDRRRRLRLQQVRQQSKEISDRLLKRTKDIAKEELKKLENSDKFSLKQIYNGKIMAVQQKYQEDMADIGQAHISAALEPDHDGLMAEKEKRNKLMASQRGKEAIKQMKCVRQKETPQQQHQERLHQVREIEDLRSTMIVSLPKKTVPKEPSICISIQNESDEENKQWKPAKKKTKKVFAKKSPGKVSKTYIKTKGSDLKIHSPVVRPKPKTLEVRAECNSSTLEQSIPNSFTEASLQKRLPTTESEYNDKTDKSPRKEVTTNISTKVDKPARYNPEDYVQATSDSSTSSDSSSSFSDDSSYFSDSGEQCINKETKTTKHVKCPTSDRIQLYDHCKHYSKTYNQPIGVVEKIHTWNEPSATDLAQEMQQAQVVESHLAESRKYDAQKRGEDAALREKVRRDYQALMRNLNQLASEERKLKASQVAHYPKDVYMQGERRKLLRDQHKKKLNRALKTLLNDESVEQPKSYPMVKRQITLTPIERSKNADAHIAWEKPTCCFNQHTETTSKAGQSKHKEAEEQISREEQILDMLKKVERQKRLLLQEFGTDLPNEIFNASMRPLFEQEKSVHTQTADFQDVQTPASPEIKVISTSPEEKCKKDEAEKEGDSVKKVEMAVQTVTEDKSVVQDKGTQVELEEKKKSKSTSVDDEIKRANVNKHHYPIEPQITVIRPEVESSDSTSFSNTIDAITEDFNKDSRKTTPKKKRYSVKTAKQTPPKIFHKSRSTRTSNGSSPAKKLSKAKSQYSSPKKSTSAEDVPNKKIKMYVDKNGLNIKLKPPQVAEVFVDVSTQSAQMYSTGTQAQTMGGQWIQSKSKTIQIKDVSDTSTTFASPPPIKPRDILEALGNNISILEMLDSSANESMKFLKGDVSPVSTPETPSPRTMQMPSNIPHPDRIKKLLRYSSNSMDSQTNGNNNALSSKIGYSAESTDSFEYRRDDQRVPPDTATDVKTPPASVGFCLCNNPECKQAHAKFDEIRDYALKNCPQILKKYEDLQNTCAERIVSLTNLIEKVRNEQKGMEFSLIDTQDETSYMQLPPPRPVTNDLQSVHRLVENIEAIHNQLVKTLIESQKIIQNRAVAKEGMKEIKETEKATSTVDNNDIKAIYPVEEKVKIEGVKAKPKIISQERVNIRLNRFKVHKSPQMMTSTPERSTWLSPRRSEEEMIEKLSQEILEQSRGFNNNSITSKEIYNSVVKHSIKTSTDNDDFRNDKIQGIDYAVTVKKNSKEVKETKNFVPLLSDIPKVSRTIETLVQPSNGRSKPPVSLLSGPYRTEIESSGHELSTIIEFDTPDTVNKSQTNNIRSSPPAKKIETQVTKSTAIVKPSEHLTSSHDLHNQHSEKLRSSPSIARLSPMVSMERVKEASIFLDSPKTSKNVANGENLRITLQETNDKKLQYDTVEELQRVCSTSTDPNLKEYKDNKDKITSSTNSNSFSELSGVSQIASTPSSTILKYASSPEEMEIALKKLGLGWAITTLKKTREASALSSSSNSDITPMNTAKRIISPVKKQFDSNYGLPDFSDVSSISIKEASKSTEQAVLLKGRTSTPKLQNSNSNNSMATNNTINTNNSGNFQEADEGLVIPNVSLTNKAKPNVKELENL